MSKKPEKRVNVGRKPIRGERLDIRRQLSFTESQYEKLKETRERTGVSIQEIVRRAIDQNLGIDGDQEIDVLGYIPASPASEVVYLPPGTTARPPFLLDQDCYGLIVTGDSMTADHGISIPSGSYAFFCAEITPHFGSIVHVEFPREDGEHDCTLKRFCPRPDGVTIHFEPLNKEHKTIVKKEGEYVIKGVFSRAWSGEEEA